MTATDRDQEPLHIFYSYSHKDEELRDALEAHLALLKREKVIESWHDRRISPGRELDQDIDENLDASRIILLLVSSHFINSDYCYNREMKRALEKHETGEAWVIPVILRPVDWKSAPFSKLKALPTDAKPITMWDNQDAAWVDVIKGIRQVIAEITEDDDLGMLDFVVAIERYRLKIVTEQERLDSITGSFGPRTTSYLEALDAIGPLGSAALAAHQHEVIGALASAITRFSEELETEAHRFRESWQRLVRYSNRYMPFVSIRTAADRKSTQTLIDHMQYLRTGYHNSSAKLQVIGVISTQLENMKVSRDLIRASRHLKQAITAVMAAYTAAADSSAILSSQLQTKMRG